MEDESSEPSGEVSGLKEEVKDLHRRLHEAQEREVDSNQQVQNLEAEHEETKVKLSDLQAKHDMISLEAVDLRKWCDNYITLCSHEHGSTVWHGTVRIKNSCEPSFIEPYRARAGLVTIQGCTAWNGTAHFLKCRLNVIHRTDNNYNHVSS